MSEKYKNNAEDNLTKKNGYPPYRIFFSLMSSWTSIWNRVNDFCLREMKVTILATLSKQCIPCDEHTKHCTQGNSFWISTKAPFHVPSIHTTNTLSSPIWLMCGMVVDNGPSVVENYTCQLFHHVPHLAHVLVINEIVEFWDKFGSEKGAVRKRGFLDTHGKTSRHDRSGPLTVHLFSGPDDLEWSIIGRTNPSPLCLPVWYVCPSP